MKYNYKQIEKILKINFNNKKLLIRSLIHKSFDESENNEKLEFLGDRVIGLVISKKLLTLYPDENEGVIDKKFANLVINSFLLLKLIFKIFSICLQLYFILIF